MSPFLDLLGSRHFFRKTLNGSLVITYHFHVSIFIPEKKLGRGGRQNEANTRFRLCLQKPDIAHQFCDPFLSWKQPF